MNIIYLSSSCSEKKFSDLVNKGITKKLPQAQKYHRLMMEGIAQCIDGSITSISAYPVNREWSKRWFFSKESETINNIHYVYNAFINFAVLRQLTRIISAKREIKKIIRGNDENIIICDVLNQSLAKAAYSCGKRYGVPVVGIVTDVPGCTSGARRKNYSFFRRKISEFAERNAKRNISKYDAYLLLTEAMNKVVNKFNKPYIVLEGHSDAKMRDVPNNVCDKSVPKVAMYAGGIHKEFGVKMLVNAFIAGGFNNWELHIYGDGNYQNELNLLTKQYSSVKYFGTKPNEFIVQQQLKASLLLNPRLTDAEYVKYSFPSKTMECMASGTPLCTTKLPGMPEEYYPYVYLFDKETEEGMLDTLRNILNKSNDELHEFGFNAKDFVLKEKDNISQARKLIDFIKTI